MSVVERETTKTVTDSDILRRAADLLEEFGWCQKHLVEVNDPEIGRWVGQEGDVGIGCPYINAFCAGGAMARAVYDLTGEEVILDDGARPGFWEWTAELLDVDETAPWNDSIMADGREVIAHLRHRADELEAKS